ncbi:ABC transporter substrate-binding protein [Corynebacterium guangdongense]|uniref:Iron(III) transport system substrate-binding protein n=1 Tax=Corynebacterium guangdongense TaxID=1783348 RepID=A0ABU1ZY54_9CORY|nr:ABC transporter substrate-binding protein [Corynebacterium guangdongense]MDR7329867.1 iron(III) transport system substrate-binding protein [Corynebacterium guangdongense]WJZ18430.1 Iron-utilization periplasmic protein precursor [Corynebacterium guangdongense]
MSRFTHRSLPSVLALGASAFLLAACAEPAEDNAASTSGSAAEGETVTLTVYTSEPEAKVDEINRAFMEANPDIEVEVYRAGTGDLNARIATEKETGTIGADVLWAADAPTFEGYAESGDLAELQDVNTDGIIDEAVDEEGYYVGTRIIPTVIAYNTDVMEQDQLPASWADLTDPKYRDQIVMPDPAVSGAAAFNASAWKNNEDLGEEWIIALGENNPMIAASNGPTSQEIAGGGHPLGVVVDYLVRDLAAEGSPIEVIYPTDGVPYITEPAGVFADSENQEAAERYINFLLSKEGQELAVEQNYLPVREDVGTPAGTPALADTALMEMDLDTIIADQANAVEVFQKAMQ